MPPVIGKIDEDLSSDEKDEEESFRTKQLFLFAWQIAKGMVIRESSFNMTRGGRMKILRGGSKNF